MDEGRAQGGFDAGLEAREEEHGADRERDAARPPVRPPHLARDEQAREAVDLRTGEPEQVRRAPQGHVDPEQPVPEIVDRRGDDRERDAPPREVIAARADEAGDPERVGGGSTAPRPAARPRARGRAVPPTSRRPARRRRGGRRWPRRRRSSRAARSRTNRGRSRCASGCPSRPRFRPPPSPTASPTGHGVAASSRRHSTRVPP